MKRVLKLSLFASLITVSGLFGDAYKLELTKTLDSNAKEQYHPDLVLPWSWNQNFASTISYRSGELNDDRLTDSLSIDEKIKHQRLKLDVLNYVTHIDDASYSIGLGWTYDDFKKNQVGSDNHLTKNYEYKNSIDIEAKGFYLKAQTIQKFSWIDMKLYAIAVPLYDIDVVQKTTVTGDENMTLESQTASSGDLNLEIDMELMSKFNNYVDLGININYRMLPLDYDLETNKGFVNIDIVEHIMKMKASLYFNFEILSGWMPVISYSKETTSTNGSSVDDRVEKKAYLGVSTRF
ncbi:MAG: hypothetical protein U9P72_07600 [Campylobacterota bacterium]|nr:hypothetical protein [Campylobacterota bacterium]